MAKKTPAGEKCERTLPFKLTEKDKAAKGELAAKLNKQLEAAEEVKKNEVSKHSAKIKDLKRKVSSELKMINEGIERRAVTCTEVKNYEKDQVEFWFEGEILETRPMTPADRQQEMKLAEKTEKVNGKKPKWQKIGEKMKGRRKAEDEETREEQIASVHQLETSKRGANSAVDPK